MAMNHPKDELVIEVGIDDELLDFFGPCEGIGTIGVLPRVTPLVIVTAFKKLLRRVRMLEEKIDDCLETQPLVYQAIDKCSALEDSVKAIKDDLVGKLSKDTTDQRGEEAGFPPPNQTTSDHSYQEDASLPPESEPVRKRRRMTKPVGPKAKMIREPEPSSSQNPSGQARNQNQVRNPKDRNDQDIGNTLNLDLNCEIEGGESEETSVGHGKRFDCKICSKTKSKSTQKKTEFSSLEALAFHYTSKHSSSIINSAQEERTGTIPLPFTDGDVVWVKSKIFPTWPVWPAVTWNWVLSPTANNNDNDRDRRLQGHQCVKYFGTHEQEIVSEDNVMRGSDYTREIEKSPNKLLTKALDELQEYFQNPRPPIMLPSSRLRKTTIQNSKEGQQSNGNHCNYGCD